MKFFKYSFILILGVIILGISGIYAFQHKIIFRPSLLPRDYKFNFSMPFQEKFIPYGEGKFIHGLVFTPESPSKRIIFFHGNARSMEIWGQAGFKLSERLNAEVFIIDYPGYGKSGDEVPSSEKELLESAQAALSDFNISKNAGLPLVIFGRSLGTGVAAWLAANNNCSGLILITPFLSLKHLASEMFPYLPTSYLVRYDLDNTRNLTNLEIPVLIIHGTNDAIVPYKHGKQLAALNRNIKFVTIENGSHDDLFSYPEYWKSIIDFVSEIK